MKKEPFIEHSLEWLKKAINKLKKIVEEAMQDASKHTIEKLKDRLVECKILEAELCLVNRGKKKEVVDSKNTQRIVKRGCEAADYLRKKLDIKITHETVAQMLLHLYAFYTKDKRKRLKDCTVLKYVESYYSRKWE